MSMEHAILSRTRRLFAHFTSEILSLYNLLADENRLQILILLLEHSCSFQDLQQMIQKGKTATAHHLRVLIDGGLINKYSRGIYSISEDAERLMVNFASSFYQTHLRKTAAISKYSTSIYEQFTPNQQLKVKEQMSKCEIEIINLPPMRVASVRALGKEPEPKAWTKLENYAKPLGLLEDLNLNPVFGFNNPDPIPGQEEYGYEFWIKIDPSIQDSPDLQKKDVILKNVSGGLYAVKKCNLTQEAQSDFMKKHGILESWFLLNSWVKKSKFSSGNHQWLEKTLSSPSGDEDIILELYHPIRRQEY